MLHITYLTVSVSLSITITAQADHANKHTTSQAPIHGSCNTASVSRKSR